MVRMSHFPVPIQRPAGLVGDAESGQSAGTGLERRDHVVKELKCREAGFDCDAVVHGETVEDVMAQAGPHAKEVHGADVTPEMAEQIQRLVRDA